MDQRQDKVIRATGRLLNLLPDNLFITDADIGVAEYIEYCETPVKTGLGSEAKKVLKAVPKSLAEPQGEKKFEICVGWMLDTNSRALIREMETIGSFNTHIKLLKPADACFTGYDEKYFRSTVCSLGIKTEAARDLSRARGQDEKFQANDKTLGLPLLAPAGDDSCGMEVTFEQPLDLRAGGLYGIVSRGVALVAACRDYEHLGRLLVPVIWPGVWPEAPQDCLCYGLMPAKYVLLAKP